MLSIQETIPLGSKTTMRIGGKARYYAELDTEEDIEQAVSFAQAHGLPVIPLGGGSNTIFADGTVHALVIRLKTDRVSIDGNRVIVDAGKILASLVHELASHNLDLSALTGIPGTVGGAIFGNAGEGPEGIWLGSFVKTVTAYADGAWKTFSREECQFQYRESMFKAVSGKRQVARTDGGISSLPLAAYSSPIIWSVTLTVPSRPAAEIQAGIERLLKRRIATQPHLKTAGSCFKALRDGTPAWKLIDAAGLRGRRIGGIQISEKHANFLLNVEKGTFEDALATVRLIHENVPAIADIEMRFYGEDGAIAA